MTMFYVLYDKDFNAIGTERSTYPVSSWKLTQKAFEFDELTIKGMKLKNSNNAMYVALKDELGATKYVALSGQPTIKDNMTSITARDIRQILNTEEVIDLTQSFSSLAALYKYLISLVLIGYTEGSVPDIVNSSIATYINGAPFSYVAIDVSRVTSMSIVSNSIESAMKAGNVWDTIQNVNAVHNCYVAASIDIDSKALTFSVIPIGYRMSIKLSDFENPRIITDSGTALTRIICTDSSYSSFAVFYRQSNEEVASMFSVDSSKIIYPHRTKVFVVDDVSEARAKGIQELYKNRYKKNLELDCKGQMGYILNNVGLNYMLEIYGFYEDSPTSSITLPVMSISNDEKGNKKIKVGRLEEYWWL